MAKPIKLPSGSWRIQVSTPSGRKSGTFATKTLANQWALHIQTEQQTIQAGGLPVRTVRQAVERYLTDVSATKDGHAWEALRLNAFLRDYSALAAKRLEDVGKADASSWRDDRLRTVSPATVRREINLIRHVWSVAIKDWAWARGNPWATIRLPPDSLPRQRRISNAEIKRILRRCGHVPCAVPVTGLQQVAYAFLVALRTAMRAGEVLQLTPESVDLGRSVARLAKTKTTRAGQTVTVPLTPAGARLLRYLPIWTLTPASLDAQWRDTRDSLLIRDLHFHDSRAEALTRLARKYDVMTLARISRHSDLRTLMRVYYRESDSDIAARL
jgi:integrase